MPTLFFTGFPGFLGSELLPRVLARHPEHTATCLVQPKFAALARKRAEELTAAHPGLRDRIVLVEGDITRRGLGLDHPAWRREVTEVYHLAAVYDLSVPRDLAVRVNVEGTRQMLDFAGACDNLERFQYFSTCFVSGRYAGIFTEDDLEKGQRFNNFYEETKYLAEIDVQAGMKAGMPTTIYRPSIVVGDSRSGATQKFDGPYYVIRWLLRQGPVAVLPMLGDPSMTRVYVVPSDFVVDAVAYLSGQPQSRNRVYALADPHALTVEELVGAISQVTHQHILRLPLPRELAKAAIDHVPGLYDFMRIPSSALDYFQHPTFYTTEHTRADLTGSGIAVPPLESYLGRMVEFVRQHPEIGAAAMV